MWKLILASVIFLILIDCGETANSDWLLEWQIVLSNNEFDSLSYEITVSDNGEVPPFAGFVLDSGYIYQWLGIRGSVEKVNSTLRPNVTLQLREKDSTLLDTTFTWEEMDFKCQMSRQYGKEYCQLSKKNINLR